MNAIQSPTVPFNLPIPGGMSLGKMITIQGTVPSTSNRFAINLLCHSGDVALHVSPKFKENYVARNNIQNLNWGPEENNGMMPIFPGQSFEIIIFCEQYNFKIAFNGCHFTEFSHRVSFNTISNIAVDGEVIIRNIFFKDSINYGNNNNNVIPSSAPYGFQPEPPSPYSNSGGMYPSNAPHPGNPNTNPYQSSGPQYPQASSLYPQQPNYGPGSHQSQYPSVPNTNSQGYPQAPDSKPGFLDQAGQALSGVLGPALMSRGIQKGSGSFGQTSGRSDYLSQAAGTLVGLIGSPGLAGLNQVQKGAQPHFPTTRSKPGLLDQAGSALSGFFRGNNFIGSALNGIKSAKKQKKAQKKALKYGLPIAGVGLGAYALHKGFKGFRRSSSSSSSSSSD